MNAPFSVPAVARAPSLNRILRAVGKRTRIGVLDFKSPGRSWHLVRARALYYALARCLTAKSTVQIEQVCGSRDHSTVLDALDRFLADDRRFEPEFSQLLSKLEVSQAASCANRISKELNS